MVSLYILENQAPALTRPDTQSLILTKGFRNGYHVLLNKKSDFAKLDKTKRFQALSEGRSVKAYALMVSYLDQVDSPHILADQVAVVYYGCQDGDVDGKDDVGSKKGTPGTEADGEPLTLSSEC